MRLRSLDIKALRALWRMRPQALAIVLVTAAGTTAFITLLGTLSSVEKTQAAYYERYRFADLFANVRSAPESRAADIARIPGVRQVTTRIVHNVVLDIAGMDEPINSLLVSAPRHDQGPSAQADRRRHRALARIYLLRRTGRDGAGRSPLRRDVDGSRRTGGSLRHARGLQRHIGVAVGPCRPD